MTHTLQEYHSDQLSHKIGSLLGCRGKSRRRSSPFSRFRVEGVEEHAVVSAVVTNEIERGNAVVIADDSFTVDDAGARAQAGQRLDDQRKGGWQSAASDFGT
jgi:hypothetical protein